MSPSQTIALYKEMDKIVTQQVAWVSLVYSARPDLISTRLRGFQGGLQGTDGGKELYTLAV